MTLGSVNIIQANRNLMQRDYKPVRGNHAAATVSCNGLYPFPSLGVKRVCLYKVLITFVQTVKLRREGIILFVVTPLHHRPPETDAIVSLLLLSIGYAFKRC